MFTPGEDEPFESDPPLQCPYRRATNRLMLWWEECSRRYTYRYTISYAERMNAPHFAQGWTGLWLRGVSLFELAAIRKFMSNVVDATLVRVRANPVYYHIENICVRINVYEAWFKRDEDALRFHNLLLSFPIRSNLVLSKIPMEPIVVSMLLEHNSYWCKNIGLAYDEILWRVAAISVQDSEDARTVLAMLKLTM